MFPSTAVLQPVKTLINDVPSLSGGSFVENSGKLWDCEKHEGGHFVLRQNDRTCDGYAIRDAFRNVFVVYLVFHFNNGMDQIMKVETTDMSILFLPTGDVLRKTVPLSTQPTQQSNAVSQPSVQQPITSKALPLIQSYKIGGVEGKTIWKCGMEPLQVVQTYCKPTH